MPELPEVQTTVEGLLRHMKGRTITDVWTDYNSLFHIGKENFKNPQYFRAVRKIINGAKVVHIRRRAKNIFIELDTEHTIVIHMKMTGHLLYGSYGFNKKKREWNALDKGPLQDPFNRFIHVVFTLSNGKHVALSDMRKFAKVMVVRTAQLDKMSEFKKLGPEPLSPSFTVELLQTQLLKRPAGKIKTVLMDQEILSGIGNIYSDEILWEAGVHPLTRVKDISADECKRIFEATRRILTYSLSLGGDSMSDYRNIEGMKGGFHPYHNAYRQHGKRCTRRTCNGTISRLKIGGRSAHYCDLHQKMA